MANAAGFAKSLTKYNTGVRVGTARAIGDYASAYFNVLLQPSITPVLTGYARSRWQMRIGRAQIPVLTAPPPRDPRATYPSPALVSWRLAKIQSVVISNNAPYIEFLNGKRSILAKANNSTAGLLQKYLDEYTP